MGHSGGLILFWRVGFHVDIQNFSRKHINAIVFDSETRPAWKFTGFYGHPETAKRKVPWVLLWHLSHLQPLPWLCIGDFNEVIDLSEIKGTDYRPKWQMEDFQRALEDSLLYNLGFKGSKLTWNNGHHDRDYTQE